MTVVRRTATANIKATLTRADAEVALRRVLNTGPHALVLNEWRGRARRRIERELVAESRGALRFCRPTLAGLLGHAYPIVIDLDRYRHVRTRAKVLHPASRVDKSPGRRRLLGPSLATVTTVDDRITGRRRRIIGYHLTAEVEHDGRDHDRDGYRDDRPLRVARHKAERAALEQLVAHYLNRGDDVEAGGDSNLDNMPIRRLVSAWEGHPDKGTLGRGRRTIDDVHGTTRAMLVETLDTPSDHAAVIATRSEPKP